MAKKQEINEKSQEISSKFDCLQELMTILKKDEETIKQNIMGATAQLQYNLGIQRTIQKLIENSST